MLNTTATDSCDTPAPRYRISERTVLLSSILILSTISAAMSYLLAQYYSTDVLSALTDERHDCTVNSSARVGTHCFGDYGWAVGLAKLSNPWAPNPPVVDPTGLPAFNDYPAAGIVPQRVFALLGELLSMPKVGLLAYLLVLGAALLCPAIWAARGACGLEKVVVFVALGAGAIPVWAVLDRGNSIGFIAPIALALLVALCRQRWGLVAVMVIAAALLRPQFLLLGVVLLGVRQWRWAGVAFGGALVSNLVAYLLWPKNFPATLTQSIHNVLAHGSSDSLADQVNGYANVSFTWVLSLPDRLGLSPAGSLVGSFGARTLIGYLIVFAVAIVVIALGRRIPPVWAATMLLATASLFPTLTYHYYLVFALPVAALLTRAPDGAAGSGLFDTPGDKRRAIGVLLSLASAASIAFIPLPVGTPLIVTTRVIAPTLWFMACVGLAWSYARRAAPPPRNPHVDVQGPTAERAAHTNSFYSSA